ncbi:MAG: hypothetical protein AAFS10_16680, partial [Myxococcota bacterium]
GFVEMTYRLFPSTRNSFTPNLLELGFNFQEMRQVTGNTELRFQIFPNAIVTPIKKELEELRTLLRGMDAGPFSYTGASFLSQDNMALFQTRVDTRRTYIQSVLRRELVDNYDKLRERARRDLQATFETLLPRLGISNTRDILSGRSWFDDVFPDKATLTGDLRLDLHIYNAHPQVLLENERFRREVEHYLMQPQQMTIFDVIEGRVVTQVDGTQADG